MRFYVLGRRCAAGIMIESLVSDRREQNKDRKKGNT